MNGLPPLRQPSLLVVGPHLVAALTASPVQNDFNVGHSNKMLLERLAQLRLVDGNDQEMARHRYFFSPTHSRSTARAYRVVPESLAESYRLSHGHEKRFYEQRRGHQRSLGGRHPEGEANPAGVGSSSSCPSVI